MSEVLILDVSRWNADNPVDPNPQQMDWNKAVDAGATGAIFRCGTGTTPDWTYEWNRSECERLNFPHGVYHAFQPASDVEDQIDFFNSRLCGTIYPAADIEVSYSAISDSEYSRRAQIYVSGIDYVIPPMIYTRGNWWDSNIGKTTWAKDYFLWVAHYVNDPSVTSFSTYNLSKDLFTSELRDDLGSNFMDEVDTKAINAEAVQIPTLPRDWSVWKFWQYTKYGDGYKYGARSPHIDLSRYNGTMDEFLNEFGSLPLPIPEPCGLYFSVKVNTLNIRKGPGTSYGLVGHLHKGEIVRATDVAGTQSWIEIAPGQWVCVQSGTTRFLTVEE